MELLNKEKITARDMPPEEGGERYALAKWGGCLVATLNSYGFDIPDYIIGVVGDHIVDDFMEAMQLAGYVAKREEQ